MYVGVEPSGEFDTFTELLASESLESFFSKRKSSIDEFDVRSLAKSVGDDGFVLFRSDGTSRVDDVTSLFRVGRDGIDSAENELLLKVREEDEIAIGLKRRDVSST